MVFVSRDVKFSENVVWNWSTSEAELLEEGQHEMSM